MLLTSLQSLLLASILQSPLLASAEPIRTPVPRALPNNPSGTYAPAKVPCPASRPRIRSGRDGLSDEETDWLEVRRKKTIEPIKDLLRRANIPDFDAVAFVNQASRGDNFTNLPNIAIAVSGGGYRALMNGAGFLAAADSRTTDATKAGGIGGLLQASTYLAGLSGGGWLVGSMFANNYSSVEMMRDGVDGSSLWKFEDTIIGGPDESGISILNTADYWGDIRDQVDAKRDAGFEVSMTDYWGRALSYQLVNDRDGGPAYTFSSIADTGRFRRGETPFPILVADGRAPGDTIISLNATVYEFTPFELGSHDPTVYGFAPLKYLASNFSAGVVPSSGSCVNGFDQYGFIMGTTSSLFNQVLLTNVSAMAPGVPDFIVDAFLDIMTSVGEDDNDIAQYAPNPFLGWNPDSNPTADSYHLDLVDGGEDLQNIPLVPLIQPVRAVDVIFAVDSSADTLYSWPNGTALRASYDRSLSPMANGTLFPPVPDANTFINLGLNKRPTFFGCDVANFTVDQGGGQTAPPPLIVYVPNAPYTAMSNMSTFGYPSYPDSERNDAIRNGYEAATQGNATLDAQWPVCVACAVVSRSLHRAGAAVPPACERCFDRYCWDGRLDARAVPEYEPDFIIEDRTTRDSAGARFAGGGGALLLSVVIAATAMLLV